MHFLDAWRPLRRQLPLLITVLLAVVIGSFAWMAASTLRHSLTVQAGMRAVSVSRQLATALKESDDRLRRDRLPLARDPAIVRVLLHPDAGTLAPAQRALDAERVNNPQATRVELWSGGGTRLLAWGAPGATPSAADVQLLRSHWSSAFGPLVHAGDSVLAEVRVPVVSPKGDTIGILREFLRLSADRSTGLLRGLVGGNAALLLGNATGDAWTDFANAAHGPSLAAVGDTGEARSIELSDRSQWIGALARVDGPPWVVWVALPRSGVLAEADPLIRRMALIALLLVVLGAGGARALSGYLVEPLEQVTTAADRIAAGDYSQRVVFRRHAELGRLASAFNHMMEEIQRGTVTMENQQVELEVQQAELEESNRELQRSLTSTHHALYSAEHARQRADAMVAGAMDCIITMDHEGRIVDFNPAAERTFGLSAPSVLGRTVSEVVVPPGMREAHERGLAHYLATGEARVIGKRLEVLALHASGREFPVELTITRIPVEGPPMFTCFLRDLTSQRQLELELRQSQKMEAVGKLAGGVAHDFNNLLTVIVSYTEMLLTDPSLPPALADDIREVRLAGDRATALTRQLLAFSRKQVLQPVRIDLNEVVGAMSSMLSRVIQEDVQLSTTLEPDLCPVRLDPSQLEQVIMNLVVNARDAMPSGGRLMIETANVELDEAYGALHPDARPGPHVMLCISDSGIGMDADTKARLFEPFFTTKGVGKGTGLGLSTVYGIVQQSGGSIYVYSEPGRGTAFKIYFPVDGSGVKASSPTRSLAAVRASNGATVLLVEDEKSVRDAVHVMLERLGYRVVTATDAEGALSVLRSATPAPGVVLTDAMMPGLSGLDLADLLLREFPGLPVVVMSGYSESTVTRGGPRLPDVTFVAKPFTLKSLGSAMASALEERA